MTNTIGVALIVKNEPSIKPCIDSFIEHVDQVVVAVQADTPQEIIDLIASCGPKVEIYNFGDWIDDFAAKRNFSFSFLKTDFVLWLDADDTLIHPENLRKLADEAGEDVGAIWFPYWYARDEFQNITTTYERERLLCRKFKWVWQTRIHETVSPLDACKFVRSDQVVVLHNHMQGASRNDRNFRILDLMLKEEPANKRIWLYMGHQHFAAQHWMNAAEWYLKFGADEGAIVLERYQALCYGAKAMREMQDYGQALQVSLAAINLMPEYKDGYLEAAQTYLRLGQFDKAIWYANMSEVKEQIKEPPTLIFVNPLDYTFNRYALMGECYLRKGDHKQALEWVAKCMTVRPTAEVQNHIGMIQGVMRQEEMSKAIKALSLELLNNRELTKLGHFLHAIPFWFRDTDDYQMLRGGIEHYTKELKNEPVLIEGSDGKSVTVNVANAFNLKELLTELDKKFDNVTVIAPLPSQDNEKQINVLSRTDMENLIMTGPGRHIVNLRMEQGRIVCEYDKATTNGIAIRLFVGQGLEYWSPDTIKSVGCGGSETAATMIGKELAATGNQVILYAMDDQVWDGVIYRHFSKYRPDSSMVHLFISSRTPEIYNDPIPALQRWLWIHDISCFDRLTPELAAQIDVMMCQTHWHADYLRRVYPWLKDAEVVDMDDQDKTFEDEGQVILYHDGATCARLPKIAIIGNALNPERFDLKEERVNNRFIWCSSPDRGLEELLVMWPMIREKMPDAELKIFYGWEYFNSSLHIPAQREFKERIRTLLEQPGVQWCGRVGQEQIAIELARADMMVYPPHDFRETYGIAFLEAQAADVLCFYRQNGGLGETIGDRGVPLSLDLTMEQIVARIVEVKADTERCAKIRQRARDYALARTWAKQAEKIMTLYQRIEDSKREQD